MKEERKPRKAGNMKVLIVVLAVILAALIMVAIFLKPENNTGPSPQTTGPQTEAQTAATEPADRETAALEETQETVPLSGYRLETPIGTVYYPEEWMDYLEVETGTEAGNFTAEFFCRLDDENISLFQLYIGSEGKGYLLGSLDNQSVWMDVRSVTDDNNRTEEENAQVTAMQDRVNDIMDQIYHMDGFQKSDL